LNALDYYNNPEITSFIKIELSFIKNKEDREDCNQEIFAELYDFMPLDVTESRRLIKRVCEKFKRTSRCIAENETGLYEAGIL
jgi:hypothetical protein